MALEKYWGRVVNAPSLVHQENIARILRHDSPMLNELKVSNVFVSCMDLEI